MGLSHNITKNNIVLIINTFSQKIKENENYSDRSFRTMKQYTALKSALFVPEHLLQQ